MFRLGRSLVLPAAPSFGNKSCCLVGKKTCGCNPWMKTCPTVMERRKNINCRSSGIQHLLGKSNWFGVSCLHVFAGLPFAANPCVLSFASYFSVLYKERIVSLLIGASRCNSVLLALENITDSVLAS
jgi:hypothetical protein